MVVLNGKPQRRTVGTSEGLAVRRACAPTVHIVAGDEVPAEVVRTEGDGSAAEVGTSCGG